MNTYESMLLQNEKALEENIRSLIEKVIKSQDEVAKAELSTISKTISYGVAIECEAYFEPHYNSLNATASFSSIEDFANAVDNEWGYAKDYTNKYDIQWDGDCSFGDFSLDKSSANISVFIDGLAENACDELVVAYRDERNKILEKAKKEKAAERVEELRRELEEAERLLSV